ncbi:MAG: multiprotein bridging factor aMBF1 [Candidatus Hermodarchaeota archaeon]
MYKKKNFDSVDECPICGGKIWGKGQKVIIEGAKLKVCQSCAQYGTKIVSNIPKDKISTIKSRRPTKKPKYSSKNALEPSLELVPDFAKRVRNSRVKANLNQEQFAQKLNEKPSLIRRIESGFEPTIKLAKKIENVFNITLLTESDKIEINTDKYMKKSSGTSLGEIAFIKKKK